jgi:hypothetical protein
MTEEEKELIKSGADAAMKPFANLLEKLFGGPLEEIGGIWTDALKIRRFKRQIRLMQRAQQIINEAGFEPKRLPDRLSIPLLNAATLEDDATLQEKWAALLANAANPRLDNRISPDFVSILGQLSSRDAKFLDVLYSEARISRAGQVFSQSRKLGGRLANEGISDREFTEDDLRDMFVTAGLAQTSDLKFITFGDLNKYGDQIQEDLRTFRLTIDSLQRQLLIVETVRGGVAPLSDGTPMVTTYSLSELGAAFVTACSASDGNQLE